MNTRALKHFRARPWGVRLGAACKVGLSQVPVCLYPGSKINSELCRGVCECVCGVGPASCAWAAVWALWGPRPAEIIGPKQHLCVFHISGLIFF